MDFAIAADKECNEGDGEGGPVDDYFLDSASSPVYCGAVPFTTKPKASSEPSASRNLAVKIQ